MARKYEQALDIMKRSKHRVGKASARLLTSDKLKVSTFASILPKDVSWVRNYLKSKRKGALTKAEKKKLSQEFFGFHFFDRIYYNATVGSDDIAKVLVHELNHYVHQAPPEMENLTETLEYEASAEMSSYLLEGQPEAKALTNAFDKVRELYPELKALKGTLQIHIWKEGHPLLKFTRISVS